MTVIASSLGGLRATQEIVPAMRDKHVEMPVKKHDNLPLFG